ncbi:unnamed protein product [Angiostrongylus costaricensis]|uniref:ShTK domain protein n=1 Tax=Angiostrongylus costaricensis TaxID=334426 RepID=A0A0R3Q0V8_ANGCS|nr:unnamed protein product [Angiostrongylus costaricensis]
MIINVGVTTPSVGNCADRLNPQTGVSDCPNRANLCNDTVYYTLMTEQCPRTCNRCPGTRAISRRTTATSPGCRDLLNPATGVSDCPQMASYCTNTLYLTLMRQQCRKTCGYCV